MGQRTMEISKISYQKVRVVLNLQMEIFTKVNIKMGKLMALGHLPCLQEINISASGKMIYKTGMAFRLGLTTVYTRASYLKPKSKAKAI